MKYFLEMMAVVSSLRKEAVFIRGKKGHFGLGRKSYVAASHEFLCVTTPLDMCDMYEY